MRRSRQRVPNRRPPTTNVGAGATAVATVMVRRKPAEELADYDALPAAFRRELSRLPLPVNPGQVLDVLERHGPAGAAIWLRQQFPGYRPI